MPDDPPTASMDRRERAEAARGYCEGSWEGVVNYMCIQPPCWMGSYSRAATSDEAEMQEHQVRFHHPPMTAP